MAWDKRSYMSQRINRAMESNYSKTNGLTYIFWENKCFPWKLSKMEKLHKAVSIFLSCCFFETPYTIDTLKRIMTLSIYLQKTFSYLLFLINQAFSGFISTYGAYGDDNKPFKLEWKLIDGPSPFNPNVESA